MKLFLASFLQKENFGPGTVISITNGSKPRDIEVNQKFSYFIPQQALLDAYYHSRLLDATNASETFVIGYQKQLENAVAEILQEAKKDSLSPQEILPFKDGDTLCSWERAEFTNYRKILAPYLMKLGYEVVLH